MKRLDVDKYLCTPWVFGECDFNKGMDCSTMCVSVQCELGNYIPDVPVCDFDDYAGMKHALNCLYDYFNEDVNWKSMGLDSNLKHGDIVVMNRQNSKSNRPLHVGTYLDTDGGKVLHTMREQGARLTPIYRFGDYNFKIIEVFRWQL